MAEAPFAILIVDDDAADLEAVASALEPLGGTLHRVSDPHDVLPSAYREAPDVVVLDALLPGLSGFDLCKQIKTDDALRDTRVLILTGVYLREQYRQEALQIFKADGFLTKPFRPPELQRIVAELLSDKTAEPVGPLLERLGLSAPAAEPPRKKGFLERWFGARREAEETRIAPSANPMEPAPDTSLDAVVETEGGAVEEPAKEEAPVEVEPSATAEEPAEIVDGAAEVEEPEEPAEVEEPREAEEPGAEVVETAETEEPADVDEIAAEVPSEEAEPAEVEPSAPVEEPSEAEEPAAEVVETAETEEPADVDEIAAEEPSEEAEPAEVDTPVAVAEPATRSAPEPEEAVEDPPFARAEDEPEGPPPVEGAAAPEAPAATDAPSPHEPDEVEAQEPGVTPPAADRVATSNGDHSQETREAVEVDEVPPGPPSSRAPLSRETGAPLYSEDDFLAELNRALAQCRRVDRPLSLVLIRIEDLAQIMELFGADIREPVLLHVARHAAESIREADVVGVLGSHPLIAVTAFASSPYGARRVAARVREALARAPFRVSDELPPVAPALGFGISSYPEDADQVTALLEAASDAIGAR